MTSSEVIEKLRRLKNVTRRFNMNGDVIVMMIAILLCIVAAGIVLFGPLQSTEIEAIAESWSAIITAASIIILVMHNRKAAKQNRDAMIHSEWAILDTERRRLESDWTLLRSQNGKGGREEQIKKACKNIKDQMAQMRKQHGDILPKLPYFTLIDESHKEQ